MNKSSVQKYKPPVRIPIPFEQFVEGVLKIDPAKMPPKPEHGKAAKKRTAAKSKKKG